MHSPGHNRHRKYRIAVSPMRYSRYSRFVTLYISRNLVTLKKRYWCAMWNPKIVSLLKGLRRTLGPFTFVRSVSVTGRKKYERYVFKRLYSHTSDAGRPSASEAFRGKNILSATDFSIRARTIFNETGTQTWTRIRLFARPMFIKNCITARVNCLRRDITNIVNNEKRIELARSLTGLRDLTAEYINHYNTARLQNAYWIFFKSTQ